MESRETSLLRPGDRPSAFWPMGGVGVVCVLAKAVHWGVPAFTYVGLRDYFRDLAVSSHADVAFCLAAGLIFGLALRLGATRPRFRRIVWGLMLAFGLITAIWAIASVQIFSFLRSPFTYGLWYLADDMRTMRSSIGSFARAPAVVAICAVPVLFWWLARRSRSWPRPGVMGMLLLAALAFGWIAYGRDAVEGKWSDRDDRLIAQNPHWALIASFAHELGGGGVPHMEVDFPPAYLTDFDPLLRSVPAALPGFSRGFKPRNLIVVVLESVGTRYLSLCGSRYPTTPRLLAESAHAMVFDNFYGHVGLTANCVAALSLSIFPYMTWREYTIEYPDYPGKTLADTLRPLGYRTAFIHSGDLGYTGQRRFLRDRGYDDLWDIYVLGEERRISSWGGDDVLLVDGVLKWIDRDPSRPFHVLAWTNESHHPYETRPDHTAIDFFQGMTTLPPDDYDLGRYLNTVHSTDEALGKLFDGLRERGLSDDTLVVVSGDHGESFGEPHSNWGHGARIYEENIHVPFAIFNPKLFPKALRSSTVGGHVDINPTATHLMGLAPDPSWHGRSLFDPKRPPRTYFFAARDDYLLGVREGHWKYIFNITRGRDELFDLFADPDEQSNLADRYPSECRRFRQRIAAWRSRVADELGAVQKAMATRKPRAD